MSTTFQRCMLSIFSEMIEKNMEVFTDDFSVFGKSFDQCLFYLDDVLKRCTETEGIVLGHKISGKGIQVNQAKIDVIDFPAHGY